MLDTVRKRYFSRRSSVQNRRVFDSGPSGVTLFSTTISGCILACRADVGITLNGSKVSGWADQSGAGNNLLQSIAIRQPTYQSTGGTGGLPWILWQGVTRQSLATGTISYAEPLDCFIVANFPNATQAATAYIFNQSNNNTTPSNLHALNYTCTSLPGQITAIDANDGNSFISGATTPAIPTAPFDAIIEAQYSAATNIQLILNNSLTPGGSGADPGTTSTQFTIGHSVNSSSFSTSFLSGIYEVAFYNRILTSGERTALTENWGTRYGITVP